MIKILHEINQPKIPPKFLAHFVSPRPKIWGGLKRKQSLGVRVLPNDRKIKNSPNWKQKSCLREVNKC